MNWNEKGWCYEKVTSEVISLGMIPHSIFSFNIFFPGNEETQWMQPYLFPLRSHPDIPLSKAAGNNLLKLQIIRHVFCITLCFLPWDNDSIKQRMQNQPASICFPSFTLILKALKWSSFGKQKQESLVKEVQSRSPALHEVLHLVITLTTGLLAATAKPVFCSSLWPHRHPQGLPHRSPKWNPPGDKSTHGIWKPVRPQESAFNAGEVQQPPFQPCFFHTSPPSSLKCSAMSRGDGGDWGGDYKCCANSHCAMSESLPSTHGHAVWKELYENALQLSLSS